VITKFALHHLPDFWKLVALVRINRFLQMGGLFYLEDVVFSFQPESYRTAIQQWIDQASASGERFSEKDFEGHVRDEYSTYSWIMEAMIKRTGFTIRKSADELELRPYRLTGFPATSSSTRGFASYILSSASMIAATSTATDRLCSSL
jgi:hypothetical protein